ncbi:hypothetical protein AK88_04988 [Plasmodium fragile]|uniref:Schizont-infected cell agglutination C-terminal domain-containing protein n=1 Tax=Plasmodium fragile TaxID=5857 RepID=A0A0D9QEF3_PLAFR|nr:uncharacterized protein AK88_04988 [Plasmodium fragile]KJP85388.1 hypothetical protein AK88_04988 [Plasmodium fragile]
MAAALGKLLVYYTTTRGIRADVNEGDTGPGSLSEIFWGDVNRVYNELLYDMEEPRNDIETLCAYIVQNGAMAQRRLEDSSLCKDIMKVYYFMDGIRTAAETSSHVTQHEDEIHPLMRCMVGYVTLAKKFAPLCQFNDLVPDVSAATDAMRQTYQVHTSNTACDGLDLASLKIGYKLVGATIKEWIHNDSTRWDEIMDDYITETCEDHTTIDAGRNSGQEKHAEKEPQGAQRPISLHDLKTLAASKDELSKDEATRVLTQIQGLTDTDSIMNKLQDAIEAVPSQRRDNSSPAKSATADTVPATTPSKAPTGKIDESKHEEADTTHTAEYGPYKYTARMYTVQIWIGNTRTTHGTGQPCAWADKEVEDSEQKCNEQEGVITKDSEFMTKIKEWANTAFFSRVKKVFEDIHKKGGSTGRCDIQKQIKTKVKQLENTVNPPTATGVRAPAPPPKPRPQPAPAPAPRPPRPPRPSDPASAKPAPPSPSGKDASGTAQKPAKPVAAKPASSSTPGTGGTKAMGTSSSGGGGGGSGGNAGTGGATAGGKGKKGKTDEKECEWKSILDEPKRKVHVLGSYSAQQLEKMKTVLQQFVEYMDKKDQYMEAMGANCNNTGWNDIDKENVYYQDQTVADVMRCRLMSGALFFANGANRTETRAQQGSGAIDTEEEKLRCEVVNAFGDILEKKYCDHKTPWRRGVKYAWKTMHNMSSQEYGPGPQMPGAVFERRCTECGYDIKNPVVRVVNGDMANLLVHDGHIMDKIGNIEHRMPCEKDWKEYTKGMTSSTHKPTVVDENDIPDIKKAEGEVISKTKEAVAKVHEILNAEIEKKKSSAEKEKKSKAKESKETSSSKLPTQDEKSQEGKNPVSSTDLGRSDPDKDNVVQPQAPASPVLPAAPPPPPPPPDSGVGTEGPKGAGQHPTQVPTESKGKEATCPKNVNEETLGTGRVSIVFAPNPECKEGTSSSDPGKAITGDAVVDGGNDDPPPLNPPKPKPNPNPDQSGSSGSFSDADLADGVSGGEGNGGGKGQPGSSGPGSTGAQDPASSTPGSADTVNPGSSGTGPTGQTNNENSEIKPPSQENLPADTAINPSVPPGLRWEDVTPYTPAIIPAVVGIGIIAFFLWKYFAYLAKRRRTYRTVRDVPSPPLDEEILEHLQRGELPPPDYGYKMIRDRQPPSTSGRARTPRMNRRTIIELHLEVLNECEATEWENVKDDYWKIVVEQFAHDLEQDPIMCSSILDVPTSHAALATHDSTTRDSCPPNKEDRWNCMETIPLATDRSPPHEHDRWSCMETIQLQPDPYPPNDPDPWRCMETIQLPTHPCPPHDPDPWSCMKNIQLATDPSASNEDDPDPWSCMDTIQLDAEQSRAHSNHRPAPSAHDLHTTWIPWIDRNKHMVRACTGQKWFLQLTAAWKQYLREHMAATAASGEHRKAATMERTKLDAWKEWVAQQHQQMSTYTEEQWFPHLLNSAEEETVPEKGEVPGVEKHLEVEKVKGTEHILTVRDVPRSQPLHPQPYMKKRFTAKTWILILAFVIEESEMEQNMHEKELYVDALLEQL